MRAVERSPQFGLALVTVASTYSAMALDGYTAPDEAWPEAARYVALALEADPDLPDAHAAAAAYAFFYRWDWQEAERQWAHAFVGQTLVRQRESRASKQGEGEPKQCRELLHASPELQDFLPEFRCPQVHHIQAHHDLRCLGEPPTGRRVWNPKVRGDGRVPCALHEIPKPVVVALLKASHSDDHRPVRSRRSTTRGQYGRPPT
jgi:hypothetical protein